jgi:hypothetical protein
MKFIEGLHLIQWLQQQDLPETEICLPLGLRDGRLIYNFCSWIIRTEFRKFSNVSANTEIANLGELESICINLAVDRNSEVTAWVDEKEYHMVTTLK